MTVDLTKLLEQYRNGDRGLATYAELQALEKQLARLQTIIDSRPAINAALPGSYIEWSQSLYALDMGAGEVRQ